MKNTIIKTISIASSIFVAFLCSCGISWAILSSSHLLPVFIALTIPGWIAVIFNIVVVSKWEFAEAERDKEREEYEK